ncbi:MAG: tyrosine-type recombinase/integrase [Candidatus Accumulibacter propinquus]|jgi:site-specific recombinase XerD
MPIKNTIRRRNDCWEHALDSALHLGRHSPGLCIVATHLLEASVDIHTIQGLLGHGHVSTTMRYFHLARTRLVGTPSPLELLTPT